MTLGQMHSSISSLFLHSLPFGRRYVDSRPPRARKSQPPFPPPPPLVSFAEAPVSRQEGGVQWMAGNEWRVAQVVSWAHALWDPVTQEYGNEAKCADCGQPRE